MSDRGVVAAGTGKVLRWEGWEAGGAPLSAELRPALAARG